MPPQRPIPPALRHRPFRIADAATLGVSVDVLRGKRFRSPFAGVYVATEVPDTLGCKADAARLVMPAGTVISHHTAAELRGLPIPSHGSVHLSTPVRGAGRRLGIVSHRCAPPAVRFAGRLLSTPTENFLELAATLSLVDLVILGDAMVRRGFVTCAQLVEAVATTSRRRGVRVARRAADLVRPRVDSPMETRVRLLIVLAGLPEPVPNLDVRDDHGERVGRADLIYALYKIILEYDGDLHRTKKGKWRIDVATREEYRRLGYDVVVLLPDDVFVHPRLTLDRIRNALVRRGHPAVPDVLAPDWAVHLPPSPPIASPWR